MEHEKIIQEIEKLLDIQDLPQEKKEKIALGLAENILKRTMIETVKILTEEEAVVFNTLAEEGKIGEAIAMVSAIHPEFNEIIKKTGEEVIEEFVEGFHS